VGWGGKRRLKHKGKGERKKQTQTDWINPNQGEFLKPEGGGGLFYLREGEREKERGNKAQGEGGK